MFDFTFLYITSCMMLPPDFPIGRVKAVAMRVVTIMRRQELVTRLALCVCVRGWFNHNEEVTQVTNDPQNRHLVWIIAVIHDHFPPETGPRWYALLRACTKDEHRELLNVNFFGKAGRASSRTLVGPNGTQQVNVEF